MTHPRASQVATASSETQVQVIAKEIGSTMKLLALMIALRVMTERMIETGDIGMTELGAGPVTRDGADSRIDTETIAEASGGISCTISKAPTSETIGINASPRLPEEGLAWQKIRRSLRDTVLTLQQKAQLEMEEPEGARGGGKKMEEPMDLRGAIAGETMNMLQEIRQLITPGQIDGETLTRVVGKHGAMKVSGTTDLGQESRTKARGAKEKETQKMRMVWLRATLLRGHGAQPRPGRLRLRSWRRHGRSGKGPYMRQFPKKRDRTRAMCDWIRLVRAPTVKCSRLRQSALGLWSR